MTPTTSPQNRQKAAVFLDRDGTIIEDVGHLARPEDVVWYDDTVPALRKLQERFLLFVVTNQVGVSLGEITREAVERVNQHVHNHLLANGIEIQKWYICPHQRTEGCDCIKPKPRFLNDAAKAFNLSLPRSFAIGDHPHDVEFATNVGGTGVYLLTGHGEQHRDDVPPNTPIFPCLSAAVDWIVDRPQ